MRTLRLGGSALLLLALAACGRQQAPADSSSVSAAGASPPPAAASPPDRRPVTEASAVTGGDGGAYGMPRAPIPYNELGDYERQRLQEWRQVPPDAGQPGRPPAPPRTQIAKPRSADTVFY